jgi:HEAT repeat protein
MGKQVLKPADKKVLMLLNQLNNGKDWVARYDAARTLGNIGNVSALPHLARALNDPNDRVRENSANAIRDIANKNPNHASLKKVISPLIKSIKDYGPILALGAIGAPALKDLQKTLKARNPTIRKHAAHAFALIAKKNPKNAIVKKSIPDLSKAVRFKDGDLQQAISEAFGEIGDKSAMPALDYVYRNGDHYNARMSADQAALKIQNAEQARIKASIMRKRKIIPKRIKKR